MEKEMVKYSSPYELKKGYEGDSGYDVRYKGDEGSFFLNGGETKLVPTGVRLEIPEGIEVQVRPKSSVSKLGILCHLGTVDTGYRNEILVILTNLTDEKLLIEKNRKIAQLVFCKKTETEMVEIEKVEEGTERGLKGFGSTGKV